MVLWQSKFVFDTNTGGNGENGVLTANAQIQQYLLDEEVVDAIDVGIIGMLCMFSIEIRTIYRHGNATC